jgi:hypothetical protein
MKLVIALCALAACGGAKPAPAPAPTPVAAAPPDAAAAPDHPPTSPTT